MEMSYQLHTPATLPPPSISLAMLCSLLITYIFYVVPLHLLSTIPWRCSGGEGIALRILDLSTRWRWVVSFTLRPHYPQGKSPCYALDRRLGELQSRSGHGGEEKNSQPIPGLEPLLFQPVAQRYTTELSWFHDYRRWFISMEHQQPEMSYTEKRSFSMSEKFQ
jgi:hypothetical protein